MSEKMCVMCQREPQSGMEGWGVFCSERCYDDHDAEFTAYCEAIKSGEMEWPT